MGKLTGEKAKQKFNLLKNLLLSVKSKWESSGNGDGTLVNGDMVDGSDRKNF